MKKHLKYLILLLVLPLLSLADGNTDALFKKGNEQYTKANYKAAVQTYQSVLAGGYQSAAVYFNIGNAYYKQGDLPSALLYYEKAHKLAPGDDDINFNIQLTTLKTTDKVEPIQQLFLTRWWNNLILGFAVSTWATLTILFLMVGFGLLAFYLFAQSVSIKKTSFFAGLALAIAGLFTMLLASSQANYFKSHRQAIVFSYSVSVKSEPVKTAKDLFVIHEGTKVDVLENNSGWARVRLANGNEGWLMASDVKNI